MRITRDDIADDEPELMFCFGGLLHAVILAYREVFNKGSVFSVISHQGQIVAISP